MSTLTQTSHQDLFARAKTYAPHAMAGIAALIFVESLRFKFANAPETQEIFGRLNGWAASLGADGLFAQTGLFSQYMIGTAELLAASLLLIGILPAFRRLQAVGAVIALAVMTGAVGFHLFTPLGIDPNGDGGVLFTMALMVWSISIALIVLRRDELRAIGGGLRRALFPKA